MGKCILAGHPPAGQGVKIVYGSVTVTASNIATVNLSGNKFVYTPTVIATAQSNDDKVLAKISGLSSSGFSVQALLSYTGTFSGTATISWIAVGT